MGIRVNTKRNERRSLSGHIFLIPWLFLHQSWHVTRFLFSVSRSKEEWKSRSEYGKWDGYGSL